MVIASMARATAALVGLATIARKRFAPTDALATETASMPLAFASQVTLVSIARC